jgi:hypothetical protein
MNPDSDLDPAISSLTLRRQQKTKFLNSFSAYFSKTRFFLLLLLDDRRIRIWEAQKHVDPVDPDPEH